MKLKCNFCFCFFLKESFLEAPVTSFLIFGFSASLIIVICYFTCFLEDEEFPDDLSSRAGHDIFDSDAEDDHQMFLNESQKNLEKAACIV